jgi:hypothetical protein
VAVSVRHGRVERRSGGNERGEHPIVLARRLEVRRRSQAGPAFQLDGPPAGVPGVRPGVDRELAVMACTTGRHTRSWLPSRTARSRSDAPTWTCQPQTAGSQVIPPFRRAIASYRGWAGTVQLGCPTGVAPIATNQASAPRAATRPPTGAVIAATEVAARSATHVLPGAPVLARQPIHVSGVHAGRTLIAEAAEATWGVYDAELLTRLPTPASPQRRRSPGLRRQSR